MSGVIRRMMVPMVTRNLGRVNKRGREWATDAGRVVTSNAMQQRYVTTVSERRASVNVPASPTWLKGTSASSSIPANIKPELLVTCVGPHQTGVVASLTKVISEHGGHITQSKSMELGLQFCLMASVWVGDREKANELRLRLNDLADNQLVCAIGTGWIPDTMHEKMIDYTTCKFKLSGAQKLGQMHTFSNHFAAMGIQMADMNHVTFPGANDKTQIAWEGTLQVPEGLSLATIREEVKKMGQEVGLKATIT